MVVMSAPITARRWSLRGQGVPLNILWPLSMSVFLCIVPGKSLSIADTLTFFFRGSEWLVSLRTAWGEKTWTTKNMHQTNTTLGKLPFSN